MDAQITLDFEVPDHDRLRDIETVLMSVLPFMADNVTVDSSVLEDEDEDITKTKAERLASAVNDLPGLTAELFWDRGPYCCRVALEENPELPLSYGEPSIYFLLEDTDSYKIFPPAGPHGWKWSGQINLHDDDHPHATDLTDISIDIIERTWLGDSERTTAMEIAKFIKLLRGAL